MSVQDKSTFSSRMQTLFNDDAVKQQFKDILETTKKVGADCWGVSWVWRVTRHRGFVACREDA
jgi:hypothetical protein